MPKHERRVPAQEDNENSVLAAISMLPFVGTVEARLCLLLCLSLASLAGFSAKHTAHSTVDLFVETIDTMADITETFTDGVHAFSQKLHWHYAALPIG